MNYRVFARHIGQFILAMGLLMIPSAAWAMWFGEWAAFTAFIESIAASVLLGAGLYFFGRRAPSRITEREALGLVGLGWLILAGVGALPFVLAGVLRPIDAYFESMSGFTTTGSTVLANIEAVDKSVLFWRSFTHWIGGMGIIVLFIAVLPILGAGGKQLFRSEAPGPDPRGLRPRIRSTAEILWRIYLGFTVIQTVFLMAAGMSFYEALCHTFGTLATGGFSTRQASIAAYDSLAIEIIMIVFMVLAGVNFGLYFSMWRGELAAPLRNTEWRAYIAILAVATALITANLMGVQGRAPFVAPEQKIRWEGQAPAAQPQLDAAYEFGPALRTAAFQTVSTMTTTGFCTGDFDRWPSFSRLLLLTLMFVGGCAGSTGGGMKVIRVVLLAKLAYRRLENTFRPKTIRAIRIRDTVIDDDMQRAVLVFFTLYVAVFVIASLLMTLIGLPFESAVSSVAATLNNIGPGLELVGAVQDYHLIPDAGKAVLSLCMAMGRLELLSVCVLILPAFWRHT